MTEDLTPQPEDPYGISKYAVELDLREAHEMFGLNHVIFRPHNALRADDALVAAVIRFGAARTESIGLPDHPGPQQEVQLSPAV